MFLYPNPANAGGAAFFVKENLRCTERSDLSKSTIDFETLWIEIQSNINHNLLYDQCNIQASTK
jgi:hypothetical protein